MQSRVWPAMVWVTACGLAHAAVAHADEQAVSVGLGWATYAVLGKAEGNMEPPTLTPTVGSNLRLSYQRALSDEVMLRASGDLASFYDTEVEYFGQASAGALFRFDVLKYVPYAYAQLAAGYSSGAQIGSRLTPLVSLGGGLQVLHSRNLSWGVELELSSFGTDLTVFTVGLRGTKSWGFF